VVIGENRTFMGAENTLRSEGVLVEVIQDEECVAIMNGFISQHPELWHEDIAV
jgi:cytosine deaminase